MANTNGDDDDDDRELHVGVCNNKKILIKEGDGLTPHISQVSFHLVEEIYSRESKT